MLKILISGAIAAAFLVLAAATALAQETNPDFVQRVIELTNAQRIANGLPALRVSGLLLQSAQSHAEDQSRRNYIAHNTPEGQAPRDRMLAVGYDPNAFVGENIYNWWGDPMKILPEAAVDWWMNSPGHRANILDPRFTEIGVGLAITAANGMHIYVQNFGSADITGPGGWGAIAYSPSTGLYTSTSGQASATDAGDLALQSCANAAQDCVVAITYHNGCGVVKRDPATGNWGAGEAGGSGMQAINAAGWSARSACIQAGGQECNELVRATCSP
jgi:uncharacterized protein YkwD